MKELENYDSNAEKNFDIQKVVESHINIYERN